MILRVITQNGARTCAGWPREKGAQGQYDTHGKADPPKNDLLQLLCNHLAEKFGLNQTGSNEGNS